MSKLRAALDTRPTHVASQKIRKMYNSIPNQIYRVAECGIVAGNHLYHSFVVKRTVAPD